MKPPLIYYGAKTRVAEQIVDMLPDHTHYIEPFAGSLAVLLAKTPSKMETVNDLDDNLMTFWQVLRDQPRELERVCALTPHSRAELALARHLDEDLDQVERARRVWVCLTQGRTGTMRSTGWRHYVDGASSSISMPRYLDGYHSRLAEVASRLRHVSLENRPALDLITDYGSKRTNLLYVDPPYAATTGRARNYQTEMTSDSDHRDLAEALHACHATIVLSGYASDLYDLELYPNWHRYELSAYTTNATTGDHQRTEVLWTNRPLVTDDAPTLDEDLFRNTAPPERNEILGTCNECRTAIVQSARGRRRQYCSTKCRIAHHRRIGTKS